MSYAESGGPDRSHPENMYLGVGARMAWPRGFAAVTYCNRDERTRSRDRFKNSRLDAKKNRGDVLERIMYAICLSSDCIE